MIKLNLKRPLVCFDLETTGLDTQKDRIIEIAVVKLNLGGEKEVISTKINPEIAIPEEVTGIHGITDDDVKDSPPFREVSKKLYESMDGCDLMGYNLASFDIPVLMAEFARCGINDFPKEDIRIIDPLKIYNLKEPRTLEFAYKFYCNNEMENAHNAESDILATIDILEGQLTRYEDLENDIDALHEFCNENLVDFAGKFKKNGEGIICYNFGKHYGKPITVDLSYLDWMLHTDFTPDTKKWVKRLYDQHTK